MNYISKVQVSDNTIYDIKDSISRQKILSQKYYEDPDVIPTSQNDFTFSVNSGIASVTGYTGDGGGVVVPYEYESDGNSYKVTSIGDWAFDECNNITSIIIPHSVTNIGSSVFLNCSGITSMTIPDSVTSIGTGAFESCSGLISITIPNSVTNMSSYVFMDCSSITSVTLPNSITAIGENMFSICSSLTNVAIPDSVTSIGGRAFADCYYLTSITIPDSVTSIGSNAFENCSPNLTIRCYKGSTADTYAQTNNIPVEYLDVKEDVIVNGSISRNSLNSALGAKADLVGIVENNNNTTTAQINPNNTVNDISVKGNLKILNNLDITSNITGSPTFTGTPKAPTAAAGTNTTQLATTAFVTNAVNNLLGASNAMIFKGTLGTGGTITALPATHEAGWTYKIITAGTYAGQVCEVGDLIICITDGTTNNNAHWTVVETNDAGNVSNSTTSASTGSIPVFDNDTGTLIKDNGFFEILVDDATPYFAKLTYNGADASFELGDNYILGSMSTRFPVSGLGNFISGENISKVSPNSSADMIDNSIIFGADIKIGSPSQNEISEDFPSGDLSMTDSLIVGKGLRNILFYDSSIAHPQYIHRNKTILGQYNDYMQNAIFQIGNGTDDTHRSNVLNLTESGALNINGNITITKSTDSTFHPLKVRDARIDIFKQDAVNNNSASSSVVITPDNIDCKQSTLNTSILTIKNNKIILQESSSSDPRNMVFQNGQYIWGSTGGDLVFGTQYEGSNRTISSDIKFKIGDKEIITLENAGTTPSQTEIHMQGDTLWFNTDEFKIATPANFTGQRELSAEIDRILLQGNEDIEIEGPITHQSIHLDSYGTKLNGPTYIFEPDTNDSTFKGTNGDSGYLSTHSLSNILTDIKNTTMLDILLWNNTEISSLNGGNAILNSSSSNNRSILFEDLSKEQFNSLQLNENGTGEIYVLYIGDTLNTALLNKIKSFGWYCVGVSEWDGNYDSSLNEISVTSISNNSLITFGIISTKDENDEYWQYVEDPNRKIFIKNIQPYSNYINNTQQNLQRKTEADFVDTQNSDIYVPQNLKILNNNCGPDLYLAFSDTGKTLDKIIYHDPDYNYMNYSNLTISAAYGIEGSLFETNTTALTENSTLEIGDFYGNGTTETTFFTGATAPEVEFMDENQRSNIFFRGDHCMNNMFYPRPNTYYIVTAKSKQFNGNGSITFKLFISVEAYPVDSTVANGAITY